MTHLQENAILISASIQHFKGKTSEELGNQVDWLKNTSTYGIELYLREAEKAGFVRSKLSTGGKLIYFTTIKGVRAYEKYRNQNGG